MVNLSEKGVLHAIVVLVITPIAGFLTSWVATHFPGLPHISSEEITVIFTAGAAAGLLGGLHFLERLPWFKDHVHVEEIKETPGVKQVTSRSSKG